MQQIPSHNREIRMLFKAAEGKVFVGGDFSQQEPRLLSSYSQDENMLKAYAEGKDLYATVAAIVHNNGYWDNMEHHEDGSPNPEGKKRRQDIKSVVLGILYGRGAPSVAEQIHTTTEEAQELIDKFFAGFPKVQEWVEKTREFARENGYVEDMWGRRRHLPDIQLPRYEVKMSEAVEKAFTSYQFNPLLGCSDRIEHKENPLIAQYESAVNQCRGRKDVEALQVKAKSDGIIIINNSGFISQAERQTVNSRVQGGAATMTKRALIKIHNDPELQKYQFQPLILVHDEIIGECLEQYADACSERLSEIMRHAAEPECTVKFKCDITATKVWYEEEYYNDLQEEVDNLRQKISSDAEVKKEILSRHIEITEKDLLDHIKFELPVESA